MKEGDVGCEGDEAVSFPLITFDSNNATRTGDYGRFTG